MKATRAGFLLLALSGCNLSLSVRTPAESAQRILEAAVADYLGPEPTGETDRRIEMERLQEVIHMASSFSRWEPEQPIRPVEGTVQAVSGRYVLLNRGRADRILEGNEFTVYRPPEFVAKVSIVRLGVDWGMARVVLKRSDPCAGDSFTNDIFGPSISR